MMKRLRKRLWLRRKMRHLETQYWDKEFTKRQLQEIREGLRQAKGRLHDQLDAAGRKLCDLKYDLFYSETGDKVAIREVPLSPEDIEKLPGHKNKEHRFHKLPKKHDKKVAESYERHLERTRPQLAQLDEQIQAIDKNINGPLIDERGNDVSIAGLMDGYKQIMDLLKKHKKTI